MVRRWTRKHEDAGYRSLPLEWKTRTNASTEKKIQALKKALQESEMENKTLKKAVSRGV